MLAYSRRIFSFVSSDYFLSMCVAARSRHELQNLSFSGQRGLIENER